MVLAFGLPAQAGGTRGRVALSVGHPTVAASSWHLSRSSNGLTGWVFRLDADADDAAYTMVTTGGTTGVEVLDAYFYEDMGDGSGPGRPCAVAFRDVDRRTETGVICPGPQVGAWGVVVLVAGADARFSLTWQLRSSSGP